MADAYRLIPRRPTGITHDAAYPPIQRGYQMEAILLAILPLPDTLHSESSRQRDDREARLCRLTIDPYQETALS